jgi:hypothetical protein
VGYNGIYFLTAQDSGIFTLTAQDDDEWRLDNGYKCMWKETGNNYSATNWYTRFCHIIQEVTL